MNVKAQLKQMNACSDAIDWIGARTIEQAWNECHNINWMLWLLCRIARNDRRCRLAAADFAERVWRLIDNEPTRLAAAWAIGAARRGDADEMLAAAAAAFAAAYAAYAADDADAAAACAACAAYGVSASAAYSAAHAVVSVSASAAASAAVSASNAASNAASAAAYSADDAYDERAAQADILRGYFTAREVAKLFNAAIAKEGKR